jgi:hypothetical protein
LSDNSGKNSGIKWRQIYEYTFDPKLIFVHKLMPKLDHKKYQKKKFLGSASTERITNNICFIAFWQISFLAASSVDGRQIWEKTKANQSPPLLLDSSRGQSYQFGNIFAIKIGKFYSK